MAWYLCTISSRSKENWHYCKKSSTWGIQTLGEYASKDRARKNDNLLFWIGGVGYVGVAKVKRDTRVPSSDDEVPWAGGKQRFGLIIPFNNLNEFENPLLFRFENRIQDKTGLDQSYFQRGYMPINDSVANVVMKFLK